jgi:hypothetical protein
MHTQNPRQEFAIRAAEFRKELANGEAAGLHEFMEEVAVDLDEKQAKAEVMFKHFDEVGFGATYKNSLQQFAIVLPDATHEGLFRSQCFDKKGFFSHSTRSTADEVILELCEDGFMEVAPGDTLETMSKTQAWVRGMAVLAVRQAVQDGRITWQEAERRYSDIEMKYDPDFDVAA